MPITKTELFKAKDTRISRIAKALAHPARVAILRQLARRNECVCGHIVDVIPLAQSTVSQHLKELRDAGLIRGEIDGPRSCYCINTKAVREYLHILRTFFEELVTEDRPENTSEEEIPWKNPQKN
jgi:ArsR family transcriptional regulator